jgi:histidinol phosphatase-like enzyme
MSVVTIFDLDGTLIESYMDRADKNYHAWSLLPGVAVAVARLRARGSVEVVTNQGGVAFGLVSEQDFQRKIADVAARLGYQGIELWSSADVVDEFGADEYGARLMRGSSGVLVARVCYADSRSRDPHYRQEAERRKPSGAMLREAQRSYPARTQFTYVGDRPEDLAAANDAGMFFCWANTFF